MYVLNISRQYARFEQRRFGFDGFLEYQHKLSG